jgi:glycosyltransferase involved in cell wall biosynthesis
LANPEPERAAPEVTIVIPTRDRWPLLSSNALRAALGQEDVSLEVVVVDDGSADGTSVRLAELGEPRLRAIRHEQPRGVAAARNTGLAAARGSWVAFLDDDDLWSPRKLRVQLDAVRAAGADFVFAGSVLVAEDGSTAPGDRIPETDGLGDAILQGNLIPAGCSNIVIRTELARTLGGFDETLRYAGDWEFWIRLARAGRAVAVDEILVAHVRHGGSDLFRFRAGVVSEIDSIAHRHTRRSGPGGVHSTRRAVVEWLVQEYRLAGSSRRRAYLEAVRAQPGVTRRSAAAAHLVLERLKRVPRLLRSGPGAEEAGAEPAPDWLQAYGSERAQPSADERAPRLGT